MSKIGRKPIEIGNAQVEIKENSVHYKGKFAEGVHLLDDLLTVKLEDKCLVIGPKKVTKNTNRLWGLHRALLSNKIHGCDLGFERVLRINGLGFKAILNSESRIQFSLGYSHKIDFNVPSDVKVEVDKSGQVMKLKSPFKDILGQVCSDIRSLRPPEPYKGTGIRYENEVILRKAGKAKS